MVLVIIITLILLLCLLFVVRKIRTSETGVSLVKISNNTKRRKKWNLKIPQTIHQTHKTKQVPLKMSEAIYTWINMNPEFEHKYYDDADLENYIYLHGDDNVTSAYKRLKEMFPDKGAMRADLFRLLVLKREGGVYADCDTSPKRRLVDILDKEDQYVTGIGRRSDFHQWLIITVPNHPFIKTALEMATRNILENKPIPGGVSIESGFAGPPLLDKAVQHVLSTENKTKSLQEGTHKIAGGSTYRVIKGDYLGGNVNFKYRGYNDDLKEMGIKHWTQK